MQTLLINEAELLSSFNFYLFIVKRISTFCICAVQKILIHDYVTCSKLNLSQNLALSYYLLFTVNLHFKTRLDVKLAT